MKVFRKIQESAKAIVALVGAVLAAGVFVLPEDAQVWVGLAVAILTAVSTYAVPNADPARPGKGDALTYNDGLAVEPDGPDHRA